ncbi:hypothetical protein F5Y05DRAFT_419687 [Hypoxylon sp. FL0543]|nr:hypothetical protein F5Y05DRAFT_419687 [Hypoxylon sp. FL0543]
MATSENPAFGRPSVSVQFVDPVVSALLNECSGAFHSIGELERSEVLAHLQLDFQHVSAEVVRVQPLLTGETLAEFLKLIVDELALLWERLVLFESKLVELLYISSAARTRHTNAGTTGSPSVHYSPNTEDERAKVRQTLEDLKRAVQEYRKIAVECWPPKLEDFLDGSEGSGMEYCYASFMGWVKTNHPLISSESNTVLAAAMSKHVHDLMNLGDVLQEEPRALLSRANFLDSRPVLDDETHDHEDAGSPLDGFFVCPEDECPERHVIYHDRSQWERHLRRDHEEDSECLCGQRFPSGAQYAEHLRTGHPHVFDESDLQDLTRENKKPRRCKMCWDFTVRSGERWSQRMLDHMACDFRELHAHCIEKARAWSGY